MSWIKLCELKKSWHTYHSEDLSQANMQAENLKLSMRELSCQPKNMRLKFLKTQRILRVE